MIRDIIQKRSGLMEYKLMLLVVLAGMVWLMVKTVLSAGGISLVGSNQALRIQAIKTHSMYGYLLLGVTFGFILLIEGKKLLFGGIMRDWLFFTHLSFAIPFFLSVAAIVIWFNGLRFAYHPWLGYISTVFFVPTVLTGLPMILRMSA